MPKARTLPHAPEAEIAVLGASLNNAEAAARAVELLREDDFYSLRNRLIYRAIARLVERGIVVDPVTVLEELKAIGALEQAGGMAYVSELLDAVPTAANLEYHARIVAERAQLRALHRAGTEIVQAVEGYTGEDVATLVDRAQQALFEAVREQGAGAVPLKAVLTPVFEDLEDKANNGGGDGITGIRSGLHDLDELTGGWQPGDLVIIAGRPSMGKTALVVGCAIEAIHRDPTVYVAIFSLEMTRQQIVQRMLAYESYVDLKRIIRGTLADGDYPRLAQAAGHLNTGRILIDDRGGLSILQVRAAARRLKSQYPGLRLVIVDYLQLMTAGEGRAENRQQEVSQISRGLKALAKELDVAVIALSQLSRRPVDRADQRPQLSDLRESGALEQDADLVIMVHRPEMYVTDKEAEEKGLVGKAELLIRKHRNGPTGTIELYYRKECCRFESLAREEMRGVA